jgi:preprotein translocase subunit SecG
MVIFLKIVHVVVCLFLIAVVLLQSGKGAEMGASFGSSGSQSVFGAGGGTTFLSKMTTGAAVIFMLTSLVLAYFAGAPSANSIMSGKSAPVAAGKLPAQASPPAAPVQGKPAAQVPVAPAQPKK